MAFTSSSSSSTRAAIASRSISWQPARSSSPRLTTWLSDPADSSRRPAQVANSASTAPILPVISARPECSDRALEAPGQQIGELDLLLGREPGKDRAGGGGLNQPVAGGGPGSGEGDGLDAAVRRDGDSLDQAPFFEPVDQKRHVRRIALQP